VTIDRDALLAALVLAPATYSRNRFFELYRDPTIARVRRRASLVRSVVRHLIASGDPPLLPALARGGRATVSFEVPAIKLRRTVMLDDLEIALVRVVSQKRLGAPLDDADPHRIRVDEAVRALDVRE
jgi:hypothetical protein